MSFCIEIILEKEWDYTSSNLRHVLRYIDDGLARVPEIIPPGKDVKIDVAHLGVPVANVTIWVEPCPPSPN